jgi:hypothetical protein
MFFVGDHSVGNDSAATGEAPCPKKAGHADGASAQHKHKTNDQAGDMRRLAVSKGWIQKAGRKTMQQNGSCVRQSAAGGDLPQMPITSSRR